jgi:hypothetical protein
MRILGFVKGGNEGVYRVLMQLFVFLDGANTLVCATLRK